MKHSLQARLTLWISVTIVAVGLPAGVVSFLSAYQEANELQDDHLRQVASLINSKSLSIVQSVADAHDPDAKLIVQTLGAAAPASDRVNAPLALPTELPDGLQTLSVQGESWRLYVVTLQPGRKVAIGQQTAGRDEVARDGALRTVVPLFVLLPILLALIGVVIRGMLRPVARLGAEVDARSEHDLRPLSAAGIPREIQPFVESINRLLTRLNLAMESQKRFIADAAHELRTPMTALVVQADNLQQLVAGASGAERLAHLKAGLTRFGHLLEQLLTMARTQSREPRQLRSISLSQTLRRVLEDLMPLIDAKSIELTVVQPEDDEHVQIDEPDGVAAIRNVVDNAIRYTPSHGLIGIRMAAWADAIRIEVIDTGPGLPPSELQRVFDPFYRAPDAPSSGSGLGLAITRGILDRIGGSITLSNATDAVSGGLKVTMVFPRNPAPARASEVGDSAGPQESIEAQS